MFNWLKSKFSNVKNKIKEIITPKEKIPVLIKYEYLELYDKKVLIDYIEKVARELSESEGVKIFDISFDEMNKDRKYSNKAIGVFIYLNPNLSKEYLIEYQYVIDESKRLSQIIPSNLVYPRIELSDIYDVFTLIHELGHYFLYKRGIVQSEIGADLYIEEFFNDHLPPFFKWIYQISISIRTNKEIDYTVEESFEYWKEYHKFKSEYGE